MNEKIRLLVIGEVGYFSLFAEGYLRFFSEKKLKIKTSTFSKPEISKEVAAILEEDYIQSKENLIPLLKATSLDFHHLIFIGDLPPDFSIKTDATIHYFKMKEELSLEQERDFIKKKVLKFLGKQGLYATTGEVSKSY